MKFLKKASAFAVLPLLAACASNWDVEGAKHAQNDGSAFQKELQAEYARLAGLEREEGDWQDAKFFVSKAIAATHGEVGPQPIEERHIPKKNVGELNVALQTLLEAYEKGGKTAAPQAAARAQAGYDCWLQEQEEDIQPEDIEACKKYFEAGLKDMFAALKEPVKPAVAPVIPDVLVYFDFDSAKLTTASEDALARVLTIAKESNVVMVTGHTDTKGDNGYNEALALSRAEAVSEYFKAHGVSARSIRVGANGESVNAITTGDNVEEARNRRVVVSFK